MTASLSITVSPAAPAVGQAVTATYAVAGNGSGPALAGTLAGTLLIGGTSYPASAPVSIAGTAATVTYSAPTCPGLSFTATPNPAVFTAVAKASAVTAATVSGAAVVGGSSLSASAPITLPGQVTPPPGSPQCYFGVWDDGSAYPGTSWAGVQKFAAAPVRSASYYLAWLGPFPTTLNALAKQNGASLYLNLEPWNTWGNGPAPTVPDIAAGKYDSYLTQIGQAIKAGGTTVKVTWAHEMNGNGWYPWQQSGGVTPAQWVAGWTRVYQVIKTTAGDLAQMVWCPNNIDVGSAAHWWPGNSLVDVVGMDAYLNTASASQTYDTFVKQTVDELSSLSGGKPVWNAETGVAGTSGSRSARITQFVSDMRADGRVSGLSWFNEGGYLLSTAETTALTAAVNAWNG